MLRKSLNIILIMFLFLLSGVLEAQDTLIVPTNDFINNTINNDTTHPHNVYVLQRDSVYYADYDIDAPFPYTMVAENGPGAKPIIRCVKNPVTGKEPYEPFDLDNNVTLKNITIDGIAADDSSFMFKVLIYPNSAGWNFIMDSCIVLNSQAQLVRVDNPCGVIKVTNTIFANSGNIKVGAVTQGKGFYINKVSIDSLMID